MVKINFACCICRIIVLKIPYNLSVLVSIQMCQLFLRISRRSIIAQTRYISISTPLASARIVCQFNHPATGTFRIDVKHYSLTSIRIRYDIANMILLCK